MKGRKRYLLPLLSLLLLLSSTAIAQDEPIIPQPAPPVKFEVTWLDKPNTAYLLYIKGSNATIVNFWKSKWLQRTAMVPLGGYIDIYNRPGVVIGINLPYPDWSDADTQPRERDLYIAIEYDGNGVPMGIYSAQIRDNMQYLPIIWR